MIWPKSLACGRHHHGSSVRRTEIRRGTGEIVAEPEGVGATSRAGDESSAKDQNPKALAGGKVLNHRYEIVRRIGGGGMGAVYLAKDRNLGDAPRAVKEMIESHLDDPSTKKRSPTSNASRCC